MTEKEVDQDRKLVERKARLAECNLKLAERLSECHDEDRKLVKHNATLAECNLKLAKRLAEYHDDDDEEEETINVNLLKKKYLRSFIGIMTTRGVMIACGSGIYGYFGGNVVTIEGTVTVGQIGILGYGVGLFMHK